MVNEIKVVPVIRSWSRERVFLVFVCCLVFFFSSSCFLVLFCFVFDLVFHCFSSLFQQYIVTSRLLKKLMNKLRCKTGPKNFYKRVQREVDAAANWPPVS